MPLPNPTYIINFTDPLKPAFAIPAYRTNGTESPISTVLDPNATSAETSLLLYGKGVDNYGERIQENLVNMMEHFAGPTPPVYPIEGQLWFDSVYNTFNGFDNLLNWGPVITPYVYTFEIVSITNTTDTIVVKHKQNLTNGDIIAVRDTNFSDGNYTVASTTYASITDETSIVVVEDLTITEGAVGVVIYAPTPITNVAGQFQYNPTTDELTVFSGSAASGSTQVILANGVSPMTADLSLGGFKITNLATPTLLTDATNKNYVDTAIAGLGSVYVLKTGDTMTGTLTMSGAGVQVVLPNAPTIGTNATNKTYVDAQDALKVSKTGDTMTGTLTMSNTTIVLTGAASSITIPNAPVAGTDATNKTYVDTAVAGAGSSVTAFSYTESSSAISLTQSIGPAFNATITYTAPTDSQTEYYEAVFGGAVSLPVTKILTDLITDDENIYPPRNNVAPTSTILPTFIGTTVPTTLFTRPITAISSGLGGSFTILGGDLSTAFSANPSFQIQDLLATYTVVAVITGLGGTWTISGNHASSFTAGDTIQITGNTGGGNGTYSVFSATNAGPNTDIVVNETIPPTAGYQDAAFTPPVGPLTPTSLGAGLFDFTVDIDGGGATVYTVTGPFVNFAALVAAMTLAFAGAATASINGGIRVTSATTGAGSSIVITDAGVNPLLFSALVADGFTTFLPSVPGIAAATGDGTLSHLHNTTYTAFTAIATGTTPLDTTTVTVAPAEFVPTSAGPYGNATYVPMPANRYDLVPKAWIDDLITRGSTTIVSYPITGFIAGGPGVGAWTVAGDVTSLFAFSNSISVEFEVGGDTGIGGNGIYTVFSATFSLGTTTIVVNETVVGTVAGDGDILLRTFETPTYIVGSNRVWPFVNGIKQFLTDDFVEEGTSGFSSLGITFTYTPPVSTKIEFMVFRS